MKVLSLKDNLKMIELMVMVNLFILMEINMKEIGIMDGNKDKDV